MSYRDDFEDCGQISVCVDCKIVEATGESTPDRPADLPEEWSAIPFGYHALPGVARHSDECDEETRSEYGCDCEQLGFSHAPCDGCGDYHYGDRYAFVLDRATLSRARREHARAIESVRMIRANRGRYPAGMLERELAIAAQWRAYVARLHKEARQHAAWLARNAASVAA